MMPKIIMNVTTASSGNGSGRTFRLKAWKKNRFRTG